MNGILEYLGLKISFSKKALKSPLYFTKLLALKAKWLHCQSRLIGVESLKIRAVCEERTWYRLLSLKRWIFRNTSH